MRLKNKTGLRVLSFLMMFVCLWMFGCVPSDKSIVRYQSVKLPTYERSDYEKLLTSEDSEVKTNAICNLIPYASVYADRLNKGPSASSSRNDSEDDAISYENARQVFDTIGLELRSSNENIKVASLIFLSELSVSYSDRKALLASVTQVNADDVRTQYEQLRALLSLVDSKIRIEKPLLQDLLNSRSWLIRSMTYRLLGDILCEELHPQLIRDYGKATREYDKLLIVNAFRQQYGPDVFNFLKEELVRSESLRIPMAIAEILPGNQEKTAVPTWICGHYQDIKENVLKRIINQYASELDPSHSITFFDIVLQANQPQLLRLIVQSPFFENLYTLFDRESQGQDLIDLRDAVQMNTFMSDAWNVCKDEKEKKRFKDEALKREILPRYTDMLESFLEDSKRLFAESGMNADEIEEATADMREILQIYRKEQAR